MSLPFARLALGGYRVGTVTPLLSRPMLRPKLSTSGVRALSKAPNYPAAGTIAKLKWLVSEYGAVGVCTHFSIYFATLGGLFLGVDNGVRRAHEPLRTHSPVAHLTRALPRRLRALCSLIRPGLFGRRCALDAQVDRGR